MRSLVQNARSVSTRLAALLLILLAVGCAALSPRASVPVDAGAGWTVLPFEHDGARQAAAQLEVLTDTVLLEKGITPLAEAGAAAARTAARSGPSARYALSATVLEWQPARRPGESGRVALALSVQDRKSGTTVLQAQDATQTGSRETMTAASTRLLRNLLAPLSPTLVGTDASSARTDVASQMMSTGEALNGYGGATALRTAAADADAPAFTTDSATADALEGRATAFHYGADLPLNLLAQFDRVVLEPENVKPDALQRLTRDGAASFAYLSIGEVGPERIWQDRIHASWVLGRNEAWNSRVIDLTSTGWSDFVLERVDALMAAGYAGLFLDTMDSFTLHARTPDAIRAQSRGLAVLIERIVARHPDIRLIANRGFEVLDEVGVHLEALAAESLYANWNNAQMRYGAVPLDDRAWLLGQLERARTQFALDIIAIDYVPPDERERALGVASRIAAHGYVPWVATPSLDHIGVGAIDVRPREVLLPYDSRVNGQQENAEVHRLLATPLEYLGYVPVYHDMATEGLPPASLGGRYAGIAFWSRGPQLTDAMQAWLLGNAREGVRIALFGTQGLAGGGELAQLAGLAPGRPVDADRAKVILSDHVIGFEAALPPRFDALGAQPRSEARDNTVHLSLGDDKGARVDLVVTGPWGGVAAHPGTVELDLEDESFWILDPFEFLKTALALEALPMPDVTSEAGKRLWLAHIDGDALPSWAELPGRQLGAEVIRDRILDRYPLPHTISVVEAEMTSIALTADRRPRMFSVMREMFARSNVEIATHSYSHPFLWGPVRTAPFAGTYNLPVGNYQYSAQREIAGSAAFIDERLAPPGKRTEVMLWTGDALPDETAIAAADDAGLANMNGGFTRITQAMPALSLVTPNVRTVGKRVQVYAPTMNENVFTNDWQGPFDGFRHVIETFRMTETPRRLKPINIYYHFYAGTKQAAVRSLEEVYAWSTAQDIHPVTVSDYVSRVHTFRTAGVARRLDGRYRLSGLGELSSVRVVGDDLALDAPRSPQVSSERRLHDGLYLAVEPARSVTIALRDVPRLAAAESAR